jgi:hypothetical protein
LRNRLNIVQLYGLTSNCRKGGQKERRRHRRPRQLVRNTGLGFGKAVLFEPFCQFLVGNVGTLQLGFQVPGAVRLVAAAP